MKLILASLVILLIAGISYCDHVLLPKIIREQLIAEIFESCECCTFSVQQVDVSFFPAILTLSNIRFSGGNPDSTAVSAEINQLSLKIVLERLLSKELYLKEAFFDGPQVDVVEGDLRSPRSKQDIDRGPPDEKFVLEAARVSDGKFSYTRTYGKRKAQLHVKNLEGTIGRIDSVFEHRETVTVAALNGRLENSGEFQFKLTTPPFSRKLSVDLDLKIEDQNLKDISHFLETSSGVKLTIAFDKTKRQVALGF